MRGRPLTVTRALVLVGFGLCGWSIALDQPSYSYARQRTPIAIAVAVDLSPSMLAIPDPTFDPGIAPRYIRGRSVLLEFFKAVEERREDVLVSLVGFTRNAEVLMGWDQSSSQVREIIEYGLSPGLHSSTGTSMEAAVETVIDVFDMLPVDLRKASRKLVILVSDGEDSMPMSFLGYALDDLAAASFDVVALQTGLLDTSEGVPVYGQVGEFLGFEAMGGELYTTPSVETMTAIANATTTRGLYVRAEDPAAAEQILQFSTNGEIDAARPGKRLVAMLGMFTIVVLLCARMLR